MQRLALCGFCSVAAFASAQTQTVVALSAEAVVVARIAPPAVVAIRAWGLLQGIAPREWWSASRINRFAILDRFFSIQAGNDLVREIFMKAHIVSLSKIGAATHHAVFFGPVSVAWLCPGRRAKDILIFQKGS